MHYRKATIEDIPELARIRKIQLHDEGPQPEETMDEELEAYFSEKMADGSLIQWVAEDDNRIIGTGAIIFMDFPPSFTNKSGKRLFLWIFRRLSRTRVESRDILQICTPVRDTAEKGLPQRFWKG